jgi:hypothetical protein
LLIRGLSVGMKRHQSDFSQALGSFLSGLKELNKNYYLTGIDQSV